MVKKKKSLTKKIVTLITTLSFISYGTPLFPLKNINSLLDTNEIVANADSGGGSDDTTGEATHSLMEHRFIFTTEDNII